MEALRTLAVLWGARPLRNFIFMYIFERISNMFQIHHIHFEYILQVLANEEDAQGMSMILLQPATVL